MMVAILVALLLVAPASAEELRTVSGGPFSMEDLLARGPAVVIFWNSWLPGSEEFVPLVREIESAATARGWRGAVVIFQDDDASAPGRLGMGTFPRVVDRRGEMARRFQVTRAPSLVLVESSGKVVQRAGPAAQEVRSFLASTARP